MRDVQPDAQSVVVTIHDDDEHLFPALQAGAFGYILKEQPRELITEQLQRISQGEPPLSPSIARRVMAYFSAKAKPQHNANAMPQVNLPKREASSCVGQGYTARARRSWAWPAHDCDYVKQIYRKLNVSRAPSGAEMQRRACRHG